MPIPPRKVHPNQPARHQDHNALVDALAALGITVAEPLALVPTGKGAAIVYEPPTRYWVRITQVGTGTQAGSYGWRQMISRPGGAWADGAAQGTVTPVHDPLYEVNGHALLTVGDRLWAERDEGSGELRGQLEHCP